ncbi:hypothetical protein L227DRAFT_613376 [Lentinus tigrinus ALCF2SS1-6]|uniref:Uncharacterized protein n=2 Tax=Lentinus tigrinus TaxID=5365 RepID=A0A5C2S293_9APHY|nr:hypothetical protein L227DRAFT_613376 [Lentinus tigrinus ALCF2SS1-6]
MSSNPLPASLLAPARQVDGTRSSFHSSPARRSLVIKYDIVADLLRERGLDGLGDTGDLLNNVGGNLGDVLGDTTGGIGPGEVHQDFNNFLECANPRASCVESIASIVHKQHNSPLNKAIASFTDVDGPQSAQLPQLEARAAYREYPFVASATALCFFGLNFGEEASRAATQV